MYLKVAMATHEELSFVACLKLVFVIHCQSLEFLNDRVHVHMLNCLLAVVEVYSTCVQRFKGTPSQLSMWLVVYFPVFYQYLNCLFNLCILSAVPCTAFTVNGFEALLVGRLAVCLSVWLSVCLSICISQQFFCVHIWVYNYLIIRTLVILVMECFDELMTYVSMQYLLVHRLAMNDFVLF